MKKDRVAILIPIKECSVRLLRKNLLLLDNTPLFDYSIYAARKSNIGQIYVTTESDEIEDLCKSNVVNILKRPLELAKDPYQIKDVCLYSLEQLKEQNKEFDTLIMIQPSNPFIQSEDIITCYNMFIKNERKTIRSVYKSTKNAYSAMYLSGNNLKAVYFQDLNRFESSNVPDTYFGNGSIVIVDIEKFKEHKTFYYEGAAAYIMPKERSIDIDDKIDFKFAEMLMI